MSYQENYQKWVDFAELPDYLRQDLENMDEKTKEDAFYTNLEFGTAGMRGLIGAGTNRINIYVVRQATEGLARLIESKGGNEKERGVAIAYDSRHFSPEFAFESAAVLAKQRGIKDIVTGVCETDFSGYPDCRDVFVKSLNVTLNLAMDYDFVIQTPLMWLDKAETWELADQLGAFDYVREKTLTCYNGIIGSGCGDCPACHLRQHGLDVYLSQKGED